MISLLLSFFAFSQKVKVISIADGDSFTVLFADNHTQRIRMHGIDCPERNQPFSSVAKKFTSDLIFGKIVYLKEKDIDRYGRLVALVYTLPSGVCINEQLLKAGLAWHFTRYDKNPKWAKLQKEAMAKKAGLWGGNEKPIEPWIWRFKRIRSSPI